MGICASCLGLERHPSQEDDETSALLDDPNAQYGSIGAGGVSQPDEEELRREREELQHITVEASDNMIDVLHPDHSDLNRHFAHLPNPHITPPEERLDRPSAAEETEHDDDDSWLETIKATAGEDIAAIRGVDQGSLVIDPGQLRFEPPTSAAKKSLKGMLPA